MPVDAVLLHQFIMFAFLNDLSFVDHNDLIGVPDGFQPVRNHDDRLLLRKVFDRLGQFFFIRYYQPELFFNFFVQFRFPFFIVALIHGFAGFQCSISVSSGQVLKEIGNPFASI